MDQLTILFCGATGRLGALASMLLDRGHRVLAATRDPGSASAGRLRQRGAEIVRADLDDVASLAAAASLADAMVAAGTAHAAGPAGDVRHGQNAVDAAKAAGLAHLVYITVAGASRSTGVPVMDSKHAVEQYLRGSGVPHTIVAPVYFMENLWNPWNEAAIAAGLLPTPVSPWRPLQQIPVADVLAFTVYVLESRAEMLSERIEIASDELSAQEASVVVSRLLGRHVGVSDRSAGQPNPLFAWLERAGTQVDIAGLRRRYPQVTWHTFAEWGAAQDWRPLGAASGHAAPAHGRRPLP